MSNVETHDALIDTLCSDLAPVNPLRYRQGVIWVGAMMALCILAVSAKFGLRDDIMSLQPATIVLYRSLALILIGTATLASALSSARPSVGTRSREWIWASMAATAIPIWALWGAINGDAQWNYVVSKSVPWCLGISLTSAAMIGGTITLWLRRGAVTEPERSGWLTGIAAGAYGTFIYNLTCPSNTVYYAGLWYSLAVVIGAGAGRIIVPRYLRW